MNILTHSKTNIIFIFAVQKERSHFGRVTFIQQIRGLFIHVLCGFLCQPVQMYFYVCEMSISYRLQCHASRRVFMYVFHCVCVHTF